MLNPAGDTGLWARGHIGAPPVVNITSATPRASGSRAPRSRATSPARSPSDGEGCSHRLSTRSGSPTTSAAVPAADRSGGRRSSSSPRATRSATPPGRLRAGATTPPTASVAPMTSLPSLPSSRRGTAGCTASAGKTRATTGPACPRCRSPRIDQALGTGDDETEQAFQLVKRVQSGSQAWVRRIVKPVAGRSGSRGPASRRSRLVGRRDDRSHHLRHHPSVGALVTAGFEFDVPVRFDTDRLDVTWDLDRLGRRVDPARRGAVNNLDDVAPRTAQGGSRRKRVEGAGRWAPVGDSGAARIWPTSTAAPFNVSEDHRRDAHEPATIERTVRRARHCRVE